MSRIIRNGLPAILTFWTFVASAAAAGAQEGSLPEEPTGPVSPGGAFLRSLAVPGWGHAAVESYTRGGFYFLTSGATLWMAYKTARSLSAAEDRLGLMERDVEAEILRQTPDQPDDLLDRIESDPRVEEAQALVDTRRQQMEDWTAFGIFWLLLNAADAFVSTHLADFPDPVEIEVLPSSGLDRGAEVRFSVPLN